MQNETINAGLAVQARTCVARFKLGDLEEHNRLLELMFAGNSHHEVRRAMRAVDFPQVLARAIVVTAESADERQDLYERALGYLGKTEFDMVLGEQVAQLMLCNATLNIKYPRIVYHKALAWGLVDSETLRHTIARVMPDQIARKMAEAYVDCPEKLDELYELGKDFSELGALQMAVVVAFLELAKSSQYTADDPSWCTRVLEQLQVYVPEFTFEPQAVTA